jgi:hypothetical protein
MGSQILRWRRSIRWGERSCEGQIKRKGKAQIVVVVVRCDGVIDLSGKEHQQPSLRSHIKPRGIPTLASSAGGINGAAMAHR